MKLKIIYTMPFLDRTFLLKLPFLPQPLSFSRCGVQVADIRRPKP
jgi:hypothetical protein